MKTLYVITRPDSINTETHIVTLNNHASDARLTPRIARSALRCAIGHTHCTAIVSDNTRAYRITPHTTRLY
jgi:hypothetical protein